MDTLFDLTGRVAIITGGGGLLGPRHAAAIARHGGVPVLVDVRHEHAHHCAQEINTKNGVPAVAIQADITDPNAIQRLLEEVLSRYGRVDVLINNAANNPKVEGLVNRGWSKVENFPL